MKIGIKTFIQYMLFVGLPLLGVFGVLWMGRSLSAPASVGGTWTLQIPEQPAQGCQPFTDWQGEMQMAISQSGSDLLIVFDDAALTAMTGKLSGMSITAATTDAAATVLNLTADVDGEASPHQMIGSVEAAGCETPLEFTGTPLTVDPGSQEH